MEKFAQLIDYSREWLLNRVYERILSNDKLKEVTSCKQGWQKALKDMSGLLIALMKNSYLPLDRDASISFDSEYVITYGTITGRKHRNRGAKLEDITQALDCFHQSYLELAELVEVEDYQAAFSQYTACFFDNFKLGLARGYNELVENNLLHKIQEESFNIYNTKVKLRGVLESLPTPVLLVNHSLQVEYYNLAANLLLREEANKNGLPISYLEVGVLLPKLTQHLHAFIDSEENQATITVQLYSSSDNSFQIQLKKFYDYQHRDENVIIIINDITDLTKLEKNRYLMENLSLFSGGIAHDFNNYLTIIRGNIDLIKRALGRKDSIEKVLANLQEVEKTTMLAANLTQQLMSFAKGEEPDRKVVNIANTLAEVVQVTAGGYAVKCQLEIQEDLWTTEIDECQIGQVFSNLIINAGEAMEHKKDEQILVKATNQYLRENEVAGLPPGQYVQVSVEDQGVGIGQQELNKIFNYYYTTKKQGQGLGLASAANIVKRHKGSILVESTRGVGSIFTVYLPATN